MTSGKRTHKFRALSDIQGVVDGAANLGAAARQLGVNRSTLTRWLQAGKVRRPTAKEGTAAGAAPGQTPEQWAAAVRALGEFDATKGALVDLAVQALTLAHTSAQPMTRLSAMGRYQQLVKQLNLTTDAQPDARQPPVRSGVQRIARAGGDPRGVLQAVK